MKPVVALLLALTSMTLRSAEYREFPAAERPIVSPVSQLPTGVRPRDPSDPGRVIDSVRVWRVHVDADGRLDLVIEGIGGGLGGPYVRIYRQGSAGFQEVLSTQGWIEPLGTVDGCDCCETSREQNAAVLGGFPSMFWVKVVVQETCRARGGTHSADHEDYRRSPIH